MSHGRELLSRPALPPESLGYCICGQPATMRGPQGDPYHYCNVCAVKKAERILAQIDAEKAEAAECKRAARAGRRRTHTPRSSANRRRRPHGRTR